MVQYINYKKSIKKFGLMYYKDIDYPYQSFVTDKLIKKYLDKKAFIDVSDGKWLNNTKEHHAQRIASLINLIINKKKELTIEVCVDEYNCYHVYDGCHRIRAYQYLKQKIPCYMIME